MGNGQHNTPKGPGLTDVGAEHSVLSAIIKHGPDFLIEVEEFLTPSAFSGSHNQKLFSILQHIAHSENATSFEAPVILSTAKALNLEDFMGKGRDQEYLESLTLKQITPQNAMKLVVVIYKLWLARQADACFASVREDIGALNGHEPLPQILTMIEDPVFALTAKMVSTASTMKRIGTGYLETMKAYAAQPTDAIGLGTGYDKYDAAIGGGLRGGSVNIVGARPKGGKSFFCLNVAHHIAQNKIPVLYLDTELSHQMQMTRLAGLVSGVETNLIETGKFALDPDKQKAVYQADEHINALPLTYCSIAGQSIKPILSIIRRWLTKEVKFNAAGKANPCCVVYDYIKLMDATDLKNNLAEYQLLGFLLTEMHNFALKYEIPVLAAVQLNRSGSDREDATALAQSDRILWLCSSFSILKKKTTEELNVDPKENGDRKLIVTDTRFGPGMEAGEYINMKSHFEKARLEQGPMGLIETSVPVNKKKKTTQ